MIYMEPGDRRADTMTIVGEGLVFRHYVTGEFKLVAKACGYLELVLKNLAEFFEAGVIEPSPRPEDRGDGIDWDGLRWTKTGHYLWKQWRQGPPRAIIELPQVMREVDFPQDMIVELPQTASGAEIPPESSMRMLTDAGWTVANAWRVTDGWVAEVGREKDGAWEECVLLLNRRGLAFYGLSRTDATTLATAILAAAR